MSLREVDKQATSKSLSMSVVGEQGKIVAIGDTNIALGARDEALFESDFIIKGSESRGDSIIFWSMVLCFAFLPVSSTLALFPFTLACFVALFKGSLFNLRDFIGKKYLYPVALFVLLPWIGLLYSKDLSLGLDYALKTKYWFAVLIMADLKIDLPRLHIFFMGFWCSLSVGALLAMMQIMGIFALPENGYPGFGLVYTVLSMYLVIGVLTVSHYFKHRNTWKIKSLYILLIVAFLFHLAVLEGRNGYFVMLLVSPLVIQNLVGAKSWVVKILLFVLFIAALAASPKVVQRVNLSLERLHRTDILLTGKIDPDFPRPYIFHSALRIIKEHPVAGGGTGSFSYYTRSTGDCVTHPHNSILYMATSFGVAGVLSIFWLFGRMFFDSFASRQNPMGFFVFSVCIVIFLGGIFETPIINAGTCLLLPIAFGCLPHIIKLGGEDI